MFAWLKQKILDPNGRDYCIGTENWNKILHMQMPSEFPIEDLGHRHGPAFVVQSEVFPAGFTSVKMIIKSY